MFNNPRSGSLAAFILLGLVSIPAGATIYTVMNNTPAVQTEAAKVAAASAGKQETVPNRDWSNGAPDSRKASAPAAESIQEPAQEQAPDLASQQQSADPVLAVSEKETETAAIAAASQETPAPEQTAEPWQTAAVQEYSAVPEYTEPAAQEPVYEEPVNEEPVYEQTVSETWQDPYYYQVYEEPYYYQPYEGPYSEEYYEPCQDVYTESYLPAYDETYYTEDYSCAPYEYSEYGYDESSGYDEAYAYDESYGYDEAYAYDESYGYDEAYAYDESYGYDEACAYDESYGYDEVYAESYDETYAEPYDETYTDETYAEPYDETYTDETYAEPYDETYTDETYAYDETYTEPVVYEETCTESYDDLNARITDAALGLVGVTDGLQCTEVATMTLANAGVEDAMDLWPDEFQPVYGEYTDTPQAGNLIYYDNGGRGVDHIAIYVGDGQAVHGNYVIDGEGYTVVAPVQYSEDVVPQYIQIQR